MRSEAVSSPGGSPAVEQESAAAETTYGTSSATSRASSSTPGRPAERSPAGRSGARPAAGPKLYRVPFENNDEEADGDQQAEDSQTPARDERGRFTSN